MDFTLLFNNEIYSWIIIPLLIFFARVADVSIGTLRVIFISKGYKYIAPFLGFFEVIIWLLAIRQIMTHLDNWICYFTYGLGFATGTFVGMYIEEKVSIGKVIIRVISKSNPLKLLNELKKAKYHVTEINGTNSKNKKVKILFMVISRHDLKNVVSLINQYGEKAFYTVEDVRFAIENGTENVKPKRKNLFFGNYRKGK